MKVNLRDLCQLRLCQSLICIQAQRGDPYVLLRFFPNQVLRVDIPDVTAEPEAFGI